MREPHRICLAPGGHPPPLFLENPPNSKNLVLKLRLVAKRP